MPWKKIAKVVGAIVVGGGVASGAPTEGLNLNISPEMIQAINTLLGAIVALLAMLTKSPKEE